MKHAIMFLFLCTFAMPCALARNRRKIKTKHTDKNLRACVIGKGDLTFIHKSFVELLSKKLKQQSAESLIKLVDKTRTEYAANLHEKDLQFLEDKQIALEQMYQQEWITETTASS